MQWKGQPEFNSKEMKKWVSGKDNVGTYKEVYIQMPGNHDTSRFTFLTIDSAGHMVRYRNAT
jgi:carboxypeptidase C (cathepsin A)